MAKLLLDKPPRMMQVARRSLVKTRTSPLQKCTSPLTRTPTLPSSTTCLMALRANKRRDAQQMEQWSRTANVVVPNKSRSRVIVDLVSILLSSIASQVLALPPAQPLRPRLQVCHRPQLLPPPLHQPLQVLSAPQAQPSTKVFVSLHHQLPQPSLLPRQPPRLLRRPHL